jgi:endo-1,4-beta-xylanase
LGYLGGACLASAATVSAQQAPGLAEIDRQSGRQFGFAIDPGYADKAPVAGLLAQHAGVIVAENAMKWRHIETVFGGRDYTDADKVLALAERLKAQVRGHTLAWHQSTPAHLTWVSSA